MKTNTPLKSETQDRIQQLNPGTPESAVRGKDMFVEQLKNERSDYIEKLLTANRTVGQLETKLHQLGGPGTDNTHH